MRMAICDDDVNALAALREQVDIYREKREIHNLDVFHFVDVTKLMESLQSQIYDIVVLDILMPKMNGIQIGKFIHKQNAQTVIIYLSSSPEFALDAYELHAVRYLIKPLKPFKLFEALDFAVSQCTRAVHYFSVKTSNGISTVPTNEIVTVELSARKMIIHMADGTSITSIYLRDTFADAVSELLEESNFAFSHKSYLVNMMFVKDYQTSQLVMKDDTLIPISRQNVVPLKKAYMAYLAHGEG